MSGFNRYLRQVMKGTYLGRTERETLVEEMQNHLDESAAHWLASGHTEESARRLAISSFGPAKEIRRRIIRETSLISPRWFLVSAVLCFLALDLALYTNMRFDDVIMTSRDPSTWTMIPNPPFVIWLHRYLPLEPSRWMVLGIMSLMFLFARTHADRMAVIVAGIPYGILLVPRIVNLKIGNALQSLVFTPGGPLSIETACVYFLCLLLPMLLYIWTRSRAISMTPWLISIGLTVWPFTRDTVQFTLWLMTKNPIFWGHLVTKDGVIATLLSITVRILILLLLLKVCRWMDVILRRTMNAV